MKTSRHAAGVTLLELVVVVVVIGVVTALALPTFSTSGINARMRDASMDLSAALSHARSEAIRTGNIHLVFYQRAADGNTLNAAVSDSTGPKIEVLIVDDGRPGSIKQNCKYDAGETVVTVRSWRDVTNGVMSGTPRVPTDLGTGDITTGSSFTDPGNNAASWVLFRPEGSPRSFDASCVVGDLGSGAGAFYMTNGDRTSAVVVKPMGGTKIHTWSGADWSS